MLKGKPQESRVGQPRLNFVHRMAGARCFKVCAGPILLSTVIGCQTGNSTPDAVAGPDASSDGLGAQIGSGGVSSNSGGASGSGVPCCSDASVDEAETGPGDSGPDMEFSADGSTDPNPADLPPGADLSGKDSPAEATSNDRPGTDAFAGQDAAIDTEGSDSRAEASVGNTGGTGGVLDGAALGGSGEIGSDSRVGGSGGALGLAGAGGSGIPGVGGGQLAGAGGFGGGGGQPAGAGGLTGGGGAPAASCGSTSPDDAWELKQAKLFTQGMLVSVFYSDLIAFAIDDVWRVGNVLDHWDGHAWVVPAAQPPSLPSMQPGGQLRGSSSSDLWFFSYVTSALYHYDGSRWINMTPSVPNINPFNGLVLWTTAKDDAWVVVSSAQAPIDGGSATLMTLMHWNGLTWSQVASPLIPDSLWSAGGTNVWATSGETLMHWNGSSWSTSVLPGARDATRGAKAMWGTSDSDIWAVGGNGSNAETWHFDGGSWEDVAISANSKLTATWGSCSANFYASNLSGLWRWNGASWSLVTVPVEGIIRISGSGPDDVWLMTTSDPNPRSTTPIMHFRPGTCGDRIVQPSAGENCDEPQGVFCTGCQVNPCSGCLSSMCSATPGCGSSQKCADLTDCLNRHQASCVGSSIQTPGMGTSCYGCVVGGCSVATGQCVTESEALANSHDPQEVLRQYQDRTTDVGKAYAQAGCFQRATSCGFYCNVSGSGT